MRNINWYSINKDLEMHKEEMLSSFDQAEKVIDSYVDKLASVGKYANSEGLEILTQTLFGFQSDDDKSKLDINMGDKYIIEFETRKAESPLLAWMKYEKKYETTDVNEIKSIVRNFFELDNEAFKIYFNF